LCRVQAKGDEVTQEYAERIYTTYMEIILSSPDFSFPVKLTQEHQKELNEVLGLVLGPLKQRYEELKLKWLMYNY